MISKKSCHPSTMEALNSFITAHPDVPLNVSIEDIYDSEMLGIYALVFSGESFESDLFRSIVIQEETLKLYCRSDYARFLTEKCKNSEAIRLLAVEGKDDERDSCLATLHNSGFDRLNVVSFLNRRDAARAAIDGIGIAMIDATCYEEEVVEGLLVQVPLEEFEFHEKHVLSINKTSENKLQVRTLLSYFNAVDNAPVDIHFKARKRMRT